MMGLNLHNVVRGAITAIHPDETVTLYQSAGQRNVKGKIVSIYNEPQEVKANFQPLDSDALKHVEVIGNTPISEQVFLYSDAPMPIAGQQRLPITRTGDIIKRSDGTYWLVTVVLEDWTWDGWCNVGVHIQTTPPDFSASDWYEG
jgi:hypothetical protein